MPLVVRVNLFQSHRSASEDASFVKFEGLTLVRTSLH